MCQSCTPNGLIITTATVSGNDCSCELNLANNEFQDDQQCFTAYDQILENLFRNDSDGVISSHVDTFCKGKCGAIVNRILNYEDRVTRVNRQVNMEFFIHV